MGWLMMIDDSYIYRQKYIYSRRASSLSSKQIKLVQQTLAVPQEPLEKRLERHRKGYALGLWHQVLHELLNRKFYPCFFFRSAPWSLTLQTNFLKISNQSSREKKQPV